MNSRESTNRAIAAAGGQAALARRLGITRQRVFSWAKEGRIPGFWVPRVLDQIEAVHGLEPADLRPDLFERAA